jgi:hypothetical protein
VLVLVLGLTACGDDDTPALDGSTPDAMSSPDAPPGIDAAPGTARSIRFYGFGMDQVDRVKIPLDVPPPDATTPGPPADLGAGDFTIEWWMRASRADNQAAAVTCGEGNLAWINGNIVLDRDRYNQDRKFGVSIAGGVLVFGVSGDGTGDATVCGAIDVLDGAWHHVAVQRRRADRRLSVFVDGALDADGPGPGGDVSYPDDGVPGDFCGGPCTDSDPFLVLAAEKHDAGPAYPSYSGSLDELRLSTTLRYAGAYPVTTEPFPVDADTAALYRFDGDVDDALGTSPAELRFGGAPIPGPVFQPDTPF